MQHSNVTLLPSIASTYISVISNFGRFRWLPVVCNQRLIRPYAEPFTFDRPTANFSPNVTHAAT